MKLAAMQRRLHMGCGEGLVSRVAAMRLLEIAGRGATGAKRNARKPGKGKR